MNRTTCHFIFCVATIVVLLAELNAAHAQNLIIANPADRGDARANLVNPALAVWQDPIFTLGSKILYYGVSDGGLDLRNSYFSLTTSNRSFGKFEALGYGVQGQVLQTPLFDAVTMNAIVGKKVHERIAVAMNLGFMNRSFDRSEFRVEDENDPLFNQLSKWIFPDFGLGIAAVPNRYVTLAFSASHLSRPDVGVGSSKVRMPVSYSAGVAVGMGYFRALIGVARDDNETLPAIAFESFRPELGLLRLGFGREAATFEGLVYVMRGVSLSYRYNYPVNDLRLASGGSHELGLVFNFKRNRSLYEAEWLEPEFVRRPVIDPATAFVVESVFDTLRFVDKFIERKIGPGVKAKDLADLPADLFFSSDSLEPDLPKIGAGKLMTAIEAYQNASQQFSDMPRDSLGMIYAMQKDHTKDYLDFLRTLAAQMQEPDFHARIVIPADGKRAYLLLKYLSLYGKLTDRLDIVVRNTAVGAAPGKLGGRKIPSQVFYRKLLAPADTFKFDLNLKDLRWGPVWWTFIMEDASGKELLTTSGEKQILRRYIWDWKLPDGQVPLPGTYYYYLRWKSADGQVYTSPKKPIVVSRDDRHITIEITRHKDLPTHPRGQATIIIN